MNNMTPGQVVFVRSGVPVTVVRAPDPVLGTRALVEFSDGTRDFVITPEIFESERAAQVAYFSDCVRELRRRIRIAEAELADMKKDAASMAKQAGLEE